MTRVLPWVAGFAVPSALLGVVYLTQGNNPAWGLVAGVIGLIGALSAELAQIVLEHRRAVAAPDLGEQFARGWAAGSEETTEDAGKIAAGVLHAELFIAAEADPREPIRFAEFMVEADRETDGAVHEGVARLHRDIHTDERDRPPE